MFSWRLAQGASCYSGDTTQIKTPRALRAGVGFFAAAGFMGLVNSPKFNLVPIKAHVVLTK